MRTYFRFRSSFGSLLVASLFAFVSAGSSVGQVPLSETPAILAEKVGLDAPWKHRALGPHYKAVFERGLTFLPALPPGSLEHRPVRFSLAHVLERGEAVPRGAERAAEQIVERRFELDHGDVLERYEVRDTGIEQSFLLRHPLRGPVEIVVNLETSLQLEPRAAKCAPLEFRDEEGTPLVRYGEAVAFDANGLEVPIETSTDGRTISLHVPEAFLEMAAFPVLVDPLIESVQVIQGAYVREAIDLACDEEGNTWITHSMRLHEHDYDLLVYRVDAAGRSTLLFTDTSEYWSTKHSTIAPAGVAGAMALSFERRFLAPRYTELYVTRFDRNTTRQSVQVHPIPAPPGSQYSMPSLGGRSHGFAPVARVRGENAPILFARCPPPRTCARCR